MAVQTPRSFVLFVAPKARTDGFTRVIKTFPPSGLGTPAITRPSVGQAFPRGRT